MPVAERRSTDGPTQSSLVSNDLHQLARFRHALRKLLRISEEAARAAGLTPQHHQLLVGVAAFTGKGWATVGELAEFLQVRHHSVVELVDRAEGLGLVRRTVNPDDRREVRVAATPDGQRKLRSLLTHHRKELTGMRRSLALLDLDGERGSIRKPRATLARGRR